MIDRTPRKPMRIGYGNPNWKPGWEEPIPTPEPVKRRWLRWPDLRELFQMVATFTAVLWWLDDLARSLIGHHWLDAVLSPFALAVVLLAVWRDRW